MPETFEEFAPAKINLALHVLGRRADGYHELDSIVAFADVGDTLVLRRAVRTSLTVDGPFATGVPTTSENLILRAYDLLGMALSLPPIHFHLTKSLPVASGIGGGSADAAAALRGILRLSEQNLPPEALDAIALKLGADVPVCLFGKACRMQGVGERITPITKAPAPAIVLVNPQLPCSTAAVFKGMALAPGQNHLTAIDVSDHSSWRNDMTDAALMVQPQIGAVLQRLAKHAQLSNVRMSGSGATCFALSDSLEAAQHTAALLRVQKPDWWIEAAKLR
jgi:4-diphosphocytidyl-2-C-methyl-D-erythritol kinase